MGFWDKAADLAKKAGGTVLDEAKAAGERSKQYNAEMPSKSDSELVSILKNERSRSPLKAGAASKELKSRGYNGEDIKNM